jgi:hypothetical protein
MFADSFGDAATPTWQLARHGHEMVCRVFRAPYGGWQIHLTYDGRDFFDQYCDDSCDPTAEGVELLEVLRAHGWVCVTN